jgi:hypothetical protein
MLDYARLRTMEVLKAVRTAVLATSGPAGLQASEFTCQAVGLYLYILVPQTSDHLFNLEHETTVTLLAAGWELKGQAQIVDPGTVDLELNLTQVPDAAWCALVRITPCQVHIRREGGWGNIETIDLKDL